ncbi:MAG: DegV family protein [Clostridia bacterium]|nr:DegV family protein [Clostridia bacterium]
MSKFVIITDSCSELSKELRQKYDIDYIPMHFRLDGVEYDASLDWEKISPKQLYDYLREGKRVTTAQITKEEYMEKFSSYLEKGYDILSLSCSSALSASVKASTFARDELKEKYPDRKIICIDTLMACAGLGILCITASELREAGKTIDEVADWVEEHKLTMNQECTVEKLTYLKVAGRVSAASAFFGGLLSIKPIIISDAKGHNFAIEKVKGRAASIERVIDRFFEAYEDLPYQHIFISHADCGDVALEMKDKVLARLGTEKEIQILPLGPIVGSTCGPGTVALYCYGKKVTTNA